MTDRLETAKQWADRVYREEFVDSGLRDRVLEVMAHAGDDFDAVGFTMDRMPAADEMPGDVYNALHERLQGCFLM